MAFNPPTFPLTVNVYTGRAWPLAAPRLVVSGNLAFGRRVTGINVGGDFDSFQAQAAAYLLVSSGTDIRGTAQLTGLAGDVVEIPEGSGCYYDVGPVDDVGLGFSNAFRCAAIYQAWGVFAKFGTALNPYPSWPTPFRP